jgi:integrase
VASGPMRLCVGLGMFGGLRTSEIRRLVWSEIGTRKIEIKAKKTKTRQSRMVPILPPLRVLIDAYDGPRAGLVAPDRWKKEFEALVGAAGWRGPDGESTWPTNAMRHSYGSYRLDEIQDENQVAAEMGNSPEMIFKHYRKVIQDGETPKFWAIRHFK